MQATIGTGDGETFQVEVDDPSRLAGKEIGETFDGGIIGLEGYKLEITGGSDEDGFPMRESVEGPARRKILLEEGQGIRAGEDGQRKRKSVRGKTVSGDIQQLNTRVVEEGDKPVDELLEDNEQDT